MHMLVIFNIYYKSSLFSFKNALFMQVSLKGDFFFAVSSESSLVISFIAVKVSPHFFIPKMYENILATGEFWQRCVDVMVCLKFFSHYFSCIYTSPKKIEVQFSNTN